MKHLHPIFALSSARAFFPNLLLLKLFQVKLTFMALLFHFVEVLL